MCRDVASMQGQNLCTVFAVYDMCKDRLANYPGLSMNDKRFQSIESFNRSDGRGEGELENKGEPYWHLEGAESESTVAAKSILAREMLSKLQQTAY